MNYDLLFFSVGKDNYLSAQRYSNWLMAMLIVVRAIVNFFHTIQYSKMEMIIDNDWNENNVCSYLSEMREDEFSITKMIIWSRLIILNVLPR